MVRTISEIREVLSSPEILVNFEPVISRISAIKSKAVSNGDEKTAKNLWCLESVAEIQQYYLEAFTKIKNGQFFEAWCSLEQVELALNRLRRHFVDEWTNLRLDFIDQKVVSLQSLYPYRIFMSPELIEHEKVCSICERPISIRSPCGHRVGEIYEGKWCGRIVTKCDFVGMSFVETPLQKYSVPFLSDPETGKSRDHYDYRLVNYLGIRWPSPYQDWEVRWTTALHAKERFGTLGNNDKCPCDSGKEYKNCCLDRRGIIRPHVVFEFRFPIPEHLQTIEMGD